MSTAPEVSRIKGILRKHKLASICEKAACPSLGECLGGVIATKLGFKSVVSAPLVCSSCYADKQVDFSLLITILMRLLSFSLQAPASRLEIAYCFIC
jgi:lipoate synthase